ncbi:probable serine/threonine-protein kinase DDB_G0286465 [Diorhabda carinulata]|uniref:probable serine/threonine-protein kinase DDB_G0286465 n=1 Tax=Diorhabda carinulata TaxID=1163345 RepID=UPI0025A1595F|nr:probable serine/threonine-protein kinase DDB_G0286465 [Diorhabda carinulata]XP_057661658.1 probable serine/threonine-protein kinase DDB_G0286465 [Diorhabda carinulata]
MSTTSRNFSHGPSRRVNINNNYNNNNANNTRYFQSRNERPNFTSEELYNNNYKDNKEEEEVIDFQHLFEPDENNDQTVNFRKEHREKESKIKKINFTPNNPLTYFENFIKTIEPESSEQIIEINFTSNNSSPKIKKFIKMKESELNYCKEINEQIELDLSKLFDEEEKDKLNVTEKNSEENIIMVGEMNNDTKRELELFDKVELNVELKYTVLDELKMNENDNESEVKGNVRIK